LEVILQNQLPDHVCDFLLLPEADQKALALAQVKYRDIQAQIVAKQAQLDEKSETLEWLLSEIAAAGSQLVGDDLGK
jgi:hypothetical protein